MIGIMGSGGGADPLISISARAGTIVAYGFGGNAVGTLRLSSDKSVYFGQRSYSPSSSDTFSNVGEWATSGATASNYEVRARLMDSAGGSMGGTFDSWLGLGTTRDWTLTDATADTSGPDGGTATASVLIEIRNASTQRLVGSASFTFTAQRYS